MSEQFDPERILAEVDESQAEVTKAKAARDAEHARRNRLYEACHLVECYDDERYAAEHGKSPPSHEAFCHAWAVHILALAKLLDADGWWAQVERALSDHPQRQYVLAILAAARAGDLDRTAWLLQEACQRGSGMAAAGSWLRGGLYRELLGLGPLLVEPALTKSEDEPPPQRPAEQTSKAPSPPDGEPTAATPVPAPASSLAIERPTIYWLDDRTYRVGRSEPVPVGDAEDNRLQAFIEHPTLSLKALAKLAGMNEGHVKIALGRLREKWDGLFADAIYRPGKGGKGLGYRATVIDARPDRKN